MYENAVICIHNTVPTYSTHKAKREYPHKGCEYMNYGGIDQRGEALCYSYWYSA